MPRDNARVSIIIPHYDGRAMLNRCLASLERTEFHEFEIVVVDNASSDGSDAMIREEFPDIRVVSSSENRGYAGGCNLGIRSTQSEYVALLNDDTEVDAGWLASLVDVLDSDSGIAAVQPKLLCLEDRNRFEYAGGAGGEMDILGYPFTRGRLFDTLEEDDGQYDDPKDVFWASGAACVIRRSALEDVGLLSETYFAHMEEIDLCWRLQWAGHRIVFVPGARIFHQSGSTLGAGRLEKMRLNHRNSLVSLLRNHTAITLLWLFPLRLMMEGITVIASVFIGQPKRSVAVILGFFGTFRLWPSIVKGQRVVRQIRRIAEGDLLHRMHRGSTALAYYLGGVKKTSELMRDD